MSVRSTVLESLHATFSTEKYIRESNEKKLKALEVTEDYGLVLTELSANSEESCAIKQLAAVLLRQYVDVHWCEQSEKFSPPETTPHVKAAIRSLIIGGLTDGDRKVRSTIASVISSIAHWDWPDDWPQLFNLLMQVLSSSDSDAVHGSMRVLSEFTRDITDTQMIDIAPVIFPELYKIFVTTGQYSNRSRSRTVAIFTTCANVIIELSQIEKSHIKRLLSPVLPQFMEAFLEALQSKDSSVTDIGIKTDIMKALTVLVRNIPSQMSSQFTSVVSCVWTCLVDTSEAYIKSYIREESDGSIEEACDSDGELLSPQSLIYAMFEFIAVLVDLPKYHPILRDNVQQLLYYVMLYAQMTTEQEECWIQSPNQFVEDEDDDSFSYSVRISALELFQSLIAEFEEVSLPALADCIQALLRQADSERKSANPSWWKIDEAVLLMLGHVRMMFSCAVKEGKVKFNLQEFLQNIVTESLLNSGHLFLSGRCIWTASRFSHVMDITLNQRYIQAMVDGLSDAQPACLRISCVRAAFHFAESLISTNQQALLEPVLSSVLDRTLSIAQSYGTEVMALCLDAIESLLKLSPEFTASVTEKTMPFCMAVFLKYSHDQHVIEICKEIITHLANVRNDLVQQKMLPTLVSIIQQRQPDKLPTSLQPGSLEMVETLVRGADHPISDALMMVFPMIANLTIVTDDSSIMQNGGECLRAYISKSAQQVVMWNDDHGHTGLQIIGSVVSKLLDPKAPEFSAAYVGRLVSLLITKLGNTLGHDLDLILRAVLGKLQQTETLTIAQELVLVFARLILTRVETLLDFLTLTPGPDGKPALNFVLTQWCSRQHLFFGNYETKVATVALSKLLLHAINANDQRLQSIYLTEEVIPQTSVIRTRAKAKASSQQFTDTPILIKIYKLLINELAHQIEDFQFYANQEADNEEDDDQEEETLLSDLIDNGELLDDDGDETDPDVLNDPIFHMNLREYLTDFIKSLSQTQYYETFKSTHTTAEMIVLRKAGIENIQ